MLSNKNSCRNRKGQSVPLAVMTLLVSSVLVYNLSFFIMDMFKCGQTNGFVKNEAENALVYGVYASNTTEKHKCDETWFSEKETEITEEDGGLKETSDGRKIKRFITFKGTTDWHDALLTGIARIYDGDKVAEEAKSEMRVNMLYDGTPQGAKEICKSEFIEMKKETWQNLSK